MSQKSDFSFFNSSTIQDRIGEIKDIYERFDYPWVIGYSGGKDSTATIQLIWNALLQVPKKKRTKPVYIISTDTLVETPVIVDFITDSLDLMRTEAKITGLPITTHKLSPEINDTFWVNLIGRGYPAPNSTFRWCTDRMKIQPSNRFILDKVAKHGEVILALGMRKGESQRRDEVIKNYEVQGYKLSRHGQLPGSWVYMPIEDFTADDVWTYLLSKGKSPWGSDNRSLASLYKSAQAGECPLVIDNTTESCGNSRFGCWTCTVVARDKSMEAMIDSGEEWMIPLLDFRDWLASTQDPEVKPQQRDYRSRDGRIKITENGKLRFRTYKLEFSKQMLERLLRTQLEVQKHDPTFVLISLAELSEIRRLWIAERNDWKDSLPKVFSSVTGQTLPTSFSDVVLPGEDELNILTELTNEHQLPIKLVQKLLDAEWQHYGMFRRSSIHSSIDKILNEDWRSWDEVQAEVSRLQKNDEA